MRREKALKTAAGRRWIKTWVAKDAVLLPRLAQSRDRKP
jgi:hypothetical protein